MNTCYYLIFLFLFTSFSYGYEKSSFYSALFDDDTNIESNTEEEGWQSNDDEIIEELKSHRASYQLEQDLLANIYAPDRTYVSVHDNRIYPSNFSYFTFKNHGTYRFILITLHGDADLYVSTRDKHVSYDNYEYSSCTCGIDEILIDPYVKRPIYIGVYGYSQYQISHYRLLIELVDATIPTDEIFNEKSTQEQQTSRLDQKPSQVVVEGEDDRSHLLWNIFVWLLNILVEVLT
ncbi:unnamed protein product [Adineta steineri]|uniref:Uncharacterized protein n=1 Tax=Adineta steineri TaxID=433720 RepID=A0A819SR10_9BILA|nr:unnamed protein product [Adineta steineri]CAF1226682.1 unnamed protein product [Adineta steineri]CAF3686298.1 unnamed protein product [Adineta steineri]CAF4067006.1 unnamed protein product [Adineta steineri]